MRPRRRGSIERDAYERFKLNIFWRFSQPNWVLLFMFEAQWLVSFYPY